MHDAEEETARYRRQLAALSIRAGDLEQQLQETSAAAAKAEEEYAGEARQLAEADAGLTELSGQVDALRSEYEVRRADALEATRAAAGLETEAAALASQVETARAAAQECLRQRDELDRAGAALAEEEQQLRRRQQELSSQAQQRQAEWTAAKQRAAELREQWAEQVAELGTLRLRHSGLTERAALLAELEQRQEGLGAGVKEVLARMREESAFRRLHGLVAELFHVSVEMAPLVELALGERTQYFIAEVDEDWFASLAEESRRLTGRVGFIRLSGDTSSTWEQPVDLEGQPGVRGRADHFVDSAAPFAPLVKRLLGRTWIVETLAHARTLSQSLGRGLTFVTLSGELLAPDGTLSVGPREGAAGLISRRSELRALKHQIAELAAKIDSLAETAAGIERETESETQRGQSLAIEHQRAADALSEHRSQLSAAETRRQQLSEQVSRLDAEQRAAEERTSRHAAALTAVRARLEAAQSRLKDSEAAGASVAARIVEVERRRGRIQREVMAAKVELAKSEERLTNLRTRRNQFEQDQQERRRSIVECRQHLAQGRRARKSPRPTFSTPNRSSPNSTCSRKGWPKKQSPPSIAAKCSAPREPN